MHNDDKVKTKSFAEGEIQLSELVIKDVEVEWKDLKFC